MDTVIAEEIVALLASDTVPDDVWFDRARKLGSSPEGLDALRRVWPTERLPVVANYFCIQRLGHGTSGVVYKALQLAPQPQLVALKLLRFVAETEKSRFFEREVRILEALDCPGVARYLASGSTGGIHFLAMELVDGIAMDEYFAAHDLSLEERLAVFRKACEAVARIHAAGVIHRDLKPRHILINEHGQPTLVDFGLSAVRSDDWSTQVRETRTQLGRIMGTYRYMAPEQAWGGLMRTDRRTDIWALGVMLYEIATDGDYPYELGPLDNMSESEALLNRIRSDTPKKPRIRHATMTPALGTLISRCLAHEPSRRLESTAQLADDIGRCLDRRGITTKPLSLPYRLRRIGIGLLLSSRLALSSATIAGVVVAVSVMARWLDVSYLVTDRGWSIETRKRVLMDEARRGPLDFLLIGIDGESYAQVPDLAAENGINNVTGNLRTWRAVHGLLMERLAAARPRAVVWDIYFPTPQEGDPAFVRGVQALAASDIPVAVAAVDYDTNGRPALSPGIRDPLRANLHHGLIVASDMVERPGEFVLTRRRGAHAQMALPLATFCALYYPKCRSEIQWVGRDKRIGLRYREEDETGYLETFDTVDLTLVAKHSRDDIGARRGDLLGYKTLNLTQPAYWKERTRSYVSALRASADELAAWAHDRVVLVIDTREPGFLKKVDRHRARYPSGEVQAVPGGYFLADAILGLHTGVYRKTEFPLSFSSFVLVVGMAAAACLAAIPLGRRRMFASRRAQTCTLAILVASAIIAGYLASRTQTRGAVEIAIGCMSAMLACACALAAEFARRPYDPSSRTAAEFRDFAQPPSDSRQLPTN